MMAFIATGVIVSDAAGPVGCSMSKQEARLPERIDKWIVPEHMLHGSSASSGCGICMQLRSAILAAVDEARDEALEEAAKLVAHPPPSSPRFRLADRIRALKSKRRA